MAAKVLITRPLIQSRLYAGELNSLGYETLVEPLLIFEALDFDVPDLLQYQAFLFTSAHGVRVFAAGAEVAGLKAVCVGMATAEAARNVGFAEVYDGGGYTDKLVEYVAKNCDTGKKLLHVRGEHVARPLHVLLSAHGFEVDILMVYKTIKVKKFSDEFLDVLQEGSLDMITFFSRRTTEAFVDLVRESKVESALEGIKALLISSSVLECMKDLNWAGAFVAATPDKAGMTQLIKENDET